MYFKQSKFRIYIYLLLTVFFLDTVYASGMMAADQLCANHTMKAEVHNHDANDTYQHEHHHVHADKTQSTNDHCVKCGHCMACFNVLPPSKLASMKSQDQTNDIDLFKPAYLSHVSTQPQKPPIS